MCQITWQIGEYISDKPLCKIVTSKHNSLKQQTFIIVPFLQVRNLGRAYMAPLAQSLSQGWNRCVGWDHSHLKAQLEEAQLTISHMIASKIEIPVGCQTVDLNFLWASSWRPPSLPWHMSFYFSRFTCQLASLRINQQGSTKGSHTFSL